MSRALSLAVFLAIVGTMAFLAGQYMPGPWYSGLAKPSWTPPNWLFGPVWTVLYVMIAVAGWLAWPADVQGRTEPAARGFWIAQLVLNGAWSPTMFGAHRIGLALAVIIALWLTISAFIAAIWQRRRAAALLFLPYFAWVSFATALNVAIWQLNR